jgi:hypothetical protein
MYFSLIYLFNLAKFISNERFKFNDNYLFNQTSNLHLKILNETKFEELYVKLDFQEKISNKKNAVIQNYYFKNSNFRKVRLTYFKSDDRQMFNSIWYPSYDYECPILTIDFVNFDKDTSIFLLNFIEIYDNDNYKKTYTNPFLEIKKNYTILNENLSIYLLPFNKILSKSFLYGNLNRTETDNILPEILQKYIKKYLSFFLKKPVNRYFIEEKHRDYNDFRKIIDLNFLPKNYFDYEWYSRFVNENYRD